MFPSPVSSVLVLALLQGSPAPRAPSTACEDLQRIELAPTPVTSDLEVCVSKGLITNFVFDVSAEVELQDEVRFVEVTRGRSTFHFIPPRDMLPGERLRLTARLGLGEAQALVTFTLVAHSGQATHQVEVYRDQRSRDSYQHEVAQERAKVQRLREQLEQLRNRLALSGELRELIASKAVSSHGIQGQVLQGLSGWPGGILLVRTSNSYRADSSVAVELWLMNSSPAPWLLTQASLVDATGNELKGLSLWQEGPLAPAASDKIIVEMRASRDSLRGELTLVLRDEAGRVVRIPGVRFPDNPPPVTDVGGGPR